MKRLLLVSTLFASCLTCMAQMQQVTLKPGQRVIIEAEGVKADTVVTPKPPVKDTVVVKPTPKPRYHTINVVINKSQQYTGAQLGVGHGDTVGIQAGTYTYIGLKDFKGTPDKPIVFVNVGGQVKLRSFTANQSNISINGCENFIFAGDGVDSLEYGFDLNAQYKDISTFVVAGLSRNVEVHHVQISYAGFAGFMMKTDPTKVNPQTWEQNFNMGTIRAHHNRVLACRGEGFYIGNSFGIAGIDVGGGARAYPHWIDSVFVYDNITRNTGCEGIQIAQAKWFMLDRNQVDSCGWRAEPFGANQNNGIQIGGLSEGTIRNTTIRNTNGWGMLIVGHGGNVAVDNVLIENSGEGIPGKNPIAGGVFIDERYRTNGFGTKAGTVVSFNNVSIVNSKTDAFGLKNETQKTAISNTWVSGVGRFLYDYNNKTTGPFPIESNNEYTGPQRAGIGYQSPLQ